MKRILLVCCLLSVSATATFAQAKPQPPTTTARSIVSKNDYYVKMNEFNTLIADNKMDAAKAKWEELHKMMGAAISDSRYRLDDVNKKNDANEKTAALAQVKKQRTIYGDLLQLKNDMAANKDIIKQKLTEFSTTML